MAANNLDSADLRAGSGGGVIREDVMDRIWDISRIPLPFQDMAGRDSSDGDYKEFVVDELSAPNTDNAHVDGSDSDQDDSVVPAREGNWHQLSRKEVRVSHRANTVTSIGRSGSLSYQVAQRQRELRRDVEAIALGGQASVQDDGSVTAGRAGALAAWIKTHTDFGATGSAGGFNPATKIVDAPTFGTARALTETLVRDIAQAVYEAGGMTRYLMGTPSVIRLMSEYLFTSSARIATMTNQDTQGTRPMTAYGSANVFVTDFGQVLTMRDNRLQQPTAANKSNLFFLDPNYIRFSYLYGYRVVPLAKTGSADKRMMEVDWTLLVTNEKSQGMIADIDETAAMTA